MLIVVVNTIVTEVIHTFDLYCWKMNQSWNFSKNDKNIKLAKLIKALWEFCTLKKNILNVIKASSPWASVYLWETIWEKRVKREKINVLLYKLRDSLRSMSRQFLSNEFAMMFLLEVSSTLNKTLVSCCSFWKKSWKFMFISWLGKMEIIYKVYQKHLFKAGSLFLLFPLVHPIKHFISTHWKCEVFSVFLHFYHRKINCQSKKG